MLPYEGVLSGLEGMLLYSPEFSDEVFGDDVFGDDVFGDDVFGDDVFGDDVFFLGMETPRELQIVRHVCSVKKREIGQFLVQNVRGFR